MDKQPLTCFVSGGIYDIKVISPPHPFKSRCPHQTLIRVPTNRRVETKWSMSASPAAPTTETSANEVEQVDAKELSKSTENLKTVMDMQKIMSILPHRYPFLLIDKVVNVVPGKSAIGVKNVTVNEPYFQGHFPDRPIMPGVLQVEALAQLGGIVMLQPPISDGKGDFFFGGVDNVRWRRPVLPGDTLVLHTALDQFKARFGIAKMTGK